MIYKILFKNRLHIEVGERIAIMIFAVANEDHQNKMYFVKNDCEGTPDFMIDLAEIVSIIPVVEE